MLNNKDLLNMVNNPWLGLLSYEDPQKTNKTYAFCGRDAAISSLFAMIDNNLLVTLYGKTGIGKTSVLNAGVFPIMRNRGYMPISVRLGKFDNTKEISYARRIICEIENELKAMGGTVETIYPEYALSNNAAVDFLWKYFGTSVFKDGKGQEVYPVIALDQLEEIFINHPEASQSLLMQIHALLDDNRELPDQKGFNDATNFRFIFSIREDDLFYLEDSIDINHLAEMKQNRYRLAPLSTTEAREVIMIGKDYIEEENTDEIASRIIKLSKDGNGLISTNILSLVCSQLFTLHEGHISLNDVSDESRSPLDAFYISCVEHISSETRKYIEDNLVDGDRRKFVNKNDFKFNVKNDEKTLMTGEYRIIQDVTAGNRECVELIHDSLARTIYHLKSEAADREKNEKLQRHNKFIKRLGFGLICALVIAIGFIISLLLDNKKFIDEKGYGTLQKISICFQEDSMINAERELWRGQLIVLGLGDKASDTLISRNINDYFRDSTLYITLDSVKSVRFLLTFDPSLKNYRPVDSTFTIGQLTDSPNVKLPVQKIIPHLLTYSSKVVADLNGEEVNMQEAIVIIRDKVLHTDIDGNFTLKLEDSLTTNDIIYIVKRGYTCFESSHILEKTGYLLPKFTIMNSDSLTAFNIECEKVSSITDWYYSTKKNMLQGEKVHGKNDYIVFNANRIPRKRTAEGYFIIEGYYYSTKEFEIKGNYSYHFFTGWLDSLQLKNSNVSFKNFEVVSYDYANNKQKIHGQYHRSGRIAGRITNIAGDVAIFGPYLTGDER